MNDSEILEWRAAFSGLASGGETLELYHAVLNTPPGPVVEIGSASGGTTIALIKAAEQVGKMVYSVDPYPEELEGVACHYPPGLMKELKEAFRKNILNGQYSNIIQYNEDLRFCIGKIPDGLSLVFIDGLHEYDSAMNEFVLLYPLVTPGGWVYIHDTCWDKGQLLGTPESGLINVLSKIDKSLFSETKIMESMFCGRK
jgi:predicted O-methyltransferase YrrM